MAHQTEKQTAFARTLRKKENDAESVLWSELRNRRLNGFKFVRELPIGPYFADFACRSRKLIVEVDGSQHVNSMHDEKRDRWLSRQGWSVLRFNNMLILRQKSLVLDIIVEVLENRIADHQESIEWRLLPSAN